MASKPTEGQKRGDDSITARTSDGQEVSIDCSVIFQIDAEQAVRIHVDWQSRYIDDFVRPVVRGIIRTLVSQYTVDEVNSSKRKDLEGELDAQVKKVFLDKGFILDRFVLRNISFSAEYAASVEAKQVAYQDTKKKEYEAEQIRQISRGQADQVKIMAEAQADAIRKKAQAEADALRLIAESLALNPDLVTYRYIDKLSPNIQVMLVPNNAPYILPLPTMGPPSPAITTTETISQTLLTTPVPAPMSTPAPTP
jgi:regulator of protease activity HflC (stomatin/prohibitin superfamily)